MQMLYDSDSYVVVSYPPEADKLGFEIVDKLANKEVYLTGEWADIFHRQILSWQENTPTQEAVEEALAGFAELAQWPLIMH